MAGSSSAAVVHPPSAGPGELAVKELASLRAYDRRRILAEIRRELTDQPTVATRRRKCLLDLTPSFDHELPVWELRVGAFRVFYDVQDDAERVHVLAVRRKEPPQKTEDIT